MTNNTAKYIEDIENMEELAFAKENDMDNFNYVEFYIKDLDEEKENDVENGHGFIITDKMGLVKGKAIRTENGIYSPKFGSVWSDDNAFEEMYRCECGILKGAMFDGRVCQNCGQKVEYKDKDVRMTGWFEFTEDYCVIHPNLYKMISSIIGPTRLIAILDSSEWDEVPDGTGFQIPEVNYNIKNIKRYDGIGMINFREKFDEIMEFFLSKAKDKKDQYDFIMANKSKVFTHSLPVIPLFLRPINISDEDYSYDKLNRKLTTLSSAVYRFNNNIGEMSDKTVKLINTSLYKIQKCYSEIMSMLGESINRKNGIIRNTVLGSRCNFTARMVITPLSEGCKINEVHMPYLAFLETYKPEIINVLCKIKGCNLATAELLWKKAGLGFDKRIYKIMNYIIKRYKPQQLLNRNPTLNFGSIQLVTVAKVKSDITDLTLSLPIQTLSLFAGDFDGDCTNSLVMKELYLIKAYRVYDIRENLAVSKDDGLFNSAINLHKEQAITLHDFCQSFTEIIDEDNPRIKIRQLTDNESYEKKVYKFSVKANKKHKIEVEGKRVFRFKMKK